MLAEVELYFKATDDEVAYMTTHPVDITCFTELATIAYKMQKETRAEFVSFGPPIERDKDGSPLITR